MNICRWSEPFIQFSSWDKGHNDEWEVSQMTNDSSSHPSRRSTLITNSINNSANNPDQPKGSTEFRVDKAIQQHQDLHWGPVLQSILMCSLYTVELVFINMLFRSIQGRILYIILFSSFNHLHHQKSVHEVAQSHYS